MTILWENNAKTTIADVTVASDATTINVATGDGALFPNPGAGEYFYATLIDTSGNREIIKVTSRSTDAMTVVRGQDGTSGRAFAQDDKFELRLTAVQLEAFPQATLLDEDDMSSDSATGVPTQQSAKAYRDNPKYGDESRYAASSAGTDTYAITLDPVPAAYFTGMVVHFKADVFNTGACTLNVNTLGAKAIKKPNGADLATGDIRTNQFVPVIYDGTNFMLMYDPGDPVGSSIIMNSETVPAGYLEEDGSAISRTTYAALFAAIGTRYGVGDGSTTFNLDDKRGRFMRGWDHGAGTDPDAAARTDSGDGSTTGDHVGTKQADAFKAHTHDLYKDGFEDGLGGGIVYGATYTNSGSGSDTGTISTGGNETRPTNITVMFCVKY
jgi:hypothetical protein